MKSHFNCLNPIFRAQAIKLHVYLAQSLERLNKLLNEEALRISNRQWDIETVGVRHKNYWLLQLSNEATKNEIWEMFKPSNLRFDTMAFSFMIKGKMPRSI